MTSTHYGVIEKPEVVLGNVELVSDMRAAHERKSPVVNARKARCQNFESNFMREDEEAGTAAGRSRVEGPTMTIDGCDAKPTLRTGECHAAGSQLR